MWTFFQDLAQELAYAFSDGLSWLGQGMGNMFNAIKVFFAMLLQPILSLVNGILYLLAQMFSIVVLVVQVIFGLIRLAASCIIGLFATFGSMMKFARSDSVYGLQYYRLPSAYREGYNAVMDFLNITGFQTLALILAVFVWVATAYAVVKMVGGSK